MKTLLLIMLPTLMSLTLHAGLSPMGTYTPCEPILTPMGTWKMNAVKTDGEWK